jgi:hypothetical protein
VGWAIAPGALSGDFSVLTCLGDVASFQLPPCQEVVDVSLLEADLESRPVLAYSRCTGRGCQSHCSWMRNMDAHRHQKIQINHLTAMLAFGLYHIQLQVGKFGVFRKGLGQAEGYSVPGSAFRLFGVKCLCQPRKTGGFPLTFALNSKYARVAVALGLVQHRLCGGCAPHESLSLARLRLWETEIFGTTRVQQ